MPLVKVNELLRHATEHHYGVAAVNVFNYETIKWVAEAASRERLPVIIQFYPGFDKYIALKHVAAIAKDFAERSEVPIGVHLDHSAGYGIAVGGVRDGFPSVMVDGSALPYEENVELTAAVVKAAEVFNVDVEAELGHVGSGANVDDIVNADHYTNVEQAVDFVERTGCGSLAVAVGHAHGAYAVGLLRGLSPKEAARLATGVSCIKCTRIGGRAGIPDWETVQRFLSTGEIDYTEIDKRVEFYGRKLQV